MSQENVDLALRAHEAFWRNDLDEFLACVDPEAEWHPLAHEIEGARHGHDGVRLWWAGLFAVFPDLRPSIAETRDLGDDFVLINMRGEGSGAESGVGIDLDLWQALEIRRGRIVWYRASRTAEEAFEAVRLRAQVR
jgi:ketosteroid isomerase-like protein